MQASVTLLPLRLIADRIANPHLFSQCAVKREDGLIISYSVQYEDGDVETDVLPLSIRAIAMGHPHVSRTRGDRIIARQQGGTKWALGKIEAVCSPPATAVDPVASRAHKTHFSRTPSPQVHEMNSGSYNVALEGIGSQAVAAPNDMRPLGPLKQVHCSA